MMRWLKFNFVGAIGAAVQASALWLLAQVLMLDYLTATALAVEAAIVHNFIWHVHWTFPDRNLARIQGKALDRAAPRSDSILRAFLRFQITAGLISIPGNLAIMWLLVEQAHFHLLVANAIAIVSCATANFLLADRFSFRHRDAETTILRTGRDTLWG